MSKSLVENIHYNTAQLNKKFKAVDIIICKTHASILLGDNTGDLSTKIIFKKSHNEHYLKIQKFYEYLRSL